MFLFSCDCGQETITGLHSVTSGRTKSCGCYSQEQKTKRSNEYVGKRFNRLTVLEEVDRISTNRRFLCICDCGNKVVVYRNCLTSGNTKSCGCFQKEVAIKKLTTHGMSGHKLRGVWRQMIKRCVDKSARHYHHYGGRGITVCDEWAASYEAFVSWAIASGWGDGLEIDRIDNDSGYSPLNCRFVTRQVNASNTRRNRIVVINGESMTLTDAARRLDINPGTVFSRIVRGKTPEQALGVCKIETG